MKSRTPLSDQHARTPINRTAALVTQNNQTEDWKERLGSQDSDSIIPYSSSPSDIKEDLTGISFGNFKVIGFYRYGKPGTGGGHRWVVRCLCSRYSIRSARAIKNPNNNNDRCDRCAHTENLKKRGTIERKPKSNTEPVKILPLPEDANEDTIGRTFDYLKVIGYGGSSGKGAKWVCQCILCNKRQYRELRDLRKGRTRCNGCG